MKTVGILSMQRIINYGSFLQAYGLKKLIEKFDCNVQYVDYRVGAPLINADENQSKLNKVLEVIKYDASLVHKVQFILYKKNFFAKYGHYLNLTKEFNYTPKLDTLVIGSDEVFNCVQKNKNVGYSLELFGKNNQANQLISYAASFGNTTIEKLKQYGKDEEIANCLREFDNISVRDSNSLSIVQELTGNTPNYNMDPVLMYDYMNECDLIPELNLTEPFLILYAYSGRITEDESNYIKEYARKKNLKIYTIGGIQKYSDKFIDCSPFEVLSYFKKAECVFTDTFHGSIFSIITNSNFVTLTRKSVGNNYGNEEKLSDLLSTLHLKDRLTYDIGESEKILDNKINYDEVNEIINMQRENTLAYLEKNIK